MKNEMRGLVYSRFSSIRDFASHIGWDRNKACQIVNGTREPRVSDLAVMAHVFGRSIQDMAHIFLPKESQNCDNR